MFYISSTPFELIPAQPKTTGTGDTLAFLSLLQALGSTRWYGLRREKHLSNYVVEDAHVLGVEILM